MSLKIKMSKRPPANKVFTYRMDKEEQRAANKECKRIYKVGLSAFLRTLILNHFPDAKKK